MQKKKLKNQESQNQSSKIQMVSCPAVVEHGKRRFLGKKVVLTTFLGGYVSKKVEKVT